MSNCENCGNKPLKNAAIEGALYRMDMINKRLAIALVVCIVALFFSNVIQFCLWSHFCGQVQKFYTENTDEIMCIIPANSKNTKEIITVCEHKLSKRKF